MHPGSALAAGQLIMMTVVVAVSLVAWLMLVFIAARHIRGRERRTSCGGKRRDCGTASLWREDSQ